MNTEVHGVERGLYLGTERDGQVLVLMECGAIERHDPERVALVACMALVDAYRRGKGNGGSLAWSDLDATHDLARQAVLLDARRRRAHRRRERPAHAS